MRELLTKHQPCRFEYTFGTFLYGGGFGNVSVLWKKSLYFASKSVICRLVVEISPRISRIDEFRGGGGGALELLFGI